MFDQALYPVNISIGVYMHCLLMIMIKLERIVSLKL